MKFGISDIIKAVSGNSSSSYRDITVQNAAQEIDRFRVIDVRQPDEFSGELGHINGAESVPLAMLEAAAVGWDRNAALLLVCRSGGRSTMACSRLNGMGFQQLHNLAGGMLAWNAAGFKIVR